MKTESLVRASVAAMFLGASVACTPPPLASVPNSSPDGPGLATGEEPPTGPAVDDGSDAPTGQLVCRTSNAVDGTSELYLEWNGPLATGVLRRVAPSGMVYTQRVKAERSNGMVVADRAGEADLAAHAAVVGQDKGKQVMRVGEGTSSWSTCK